MDEQIGKFLVGIMMALGISFFCALREGDIDTNTFLACFAIAIAVMCWIPLLPYYMIALSVGMIVVMLLEKRSVGI